MKTLTKAFIGLSAVGATYVGVQKIRHGLSDELQSHVDVHGLMGPGYEAVRDAFTENFTRRGELGAACCVYHKGEKVVDLWGGVRNKATGETWEEDTMALVYSATKGMSAMTLAIAHSRGWLDYDDLVCKYWPEFAQNGKGGPVNRAEEPPVIGQPHPYPEQRQNKTNTLDKPFSSESQRNGPNGNSVKE